MWTSFGVPKRRSTLAEYRIMKVFPLRAVSTEETNIGGRAPPSYDDNILALCEGPLAMHDDTETMCDAGVPADHSAWKPLIARRGLMLGLVRATPASRREGPVAKARVLTIPDIGVIDSAAEDVLRLSGD